MDTPVTTNTTNLRISATPVFDERLNKWRVLIVRTENGEMQAYLERATFPNKHLADLQAQLTLQMLKAQLEHAGQAVKEHNAPVKPEDVG